MLAIRSSMAVFTFATHLNSDISQISEAAYPNGRYSCIAELSTKNRETFLQCYTTLGKAHIRAAKKIGLAECSAGFAVRLGGSPISKTYFSHCEGKGHTPPPKYGPDFTPELVF